MPVTAIPQLPGIVKDDTGTMAKPRWTDCDKIRFVGGLPETVGGWESAILDAFAGKCRGMHSWALASGNWAVAVGTSSNLYVLTGGGLYDITPTARRLRDLAANPLSVTSGSATVTVTDKAHGAVAGEQVTLNGAAAVGGITPIGTYTIATVTDADRYTITHTSVASATATGGGSAVSALYPKAFAAGLEDGTGGLGFGTGAYGVDTYGNSSATEYRPRVWTFANFGPDLLACPLNGTVYRWTGNVSMPAAPLANAPARVDTMFLDPNGLVVACGSNEQASGTFNPLLVRNSDIEAITDWTASAADLAGEFPLRIGSRLVRGLPARGYNLLWTDAALVGMEFTGDPDLVYRYTVLGTECGLIGPNAAAVANGGAYWMAPNGQFYQWTGGAPQPIPCTVRRYVFDKMSLVQADKIVAFSNAAFNEVGWVYPDSRDGNECSRYVLLSLTDGSWSIGTTDRTCRIDARAIPSPISATGGGRLYFEERGNSADGGAFAWSLTGSHIDISDGERVMEIQEIFPDFAYLQGGCDIYLDAYDYPQSAPVPHGPFAATSATERLYPLVTARQVAVRLQGNASPARMRLGKLLVDVVDTGDRY